MQQTAPAACGAQQTHEGAEVLLLVYCFLASKASMRMKPFTCVHVYVLI
jgi:hypothetical protein